MEALSFDQMLGVAGLILALIGIVAGFGVAIGMDARTRGEFRFAVGCFVFSALMLLGSISVWAVGTEVRSMWRIILTGLMFAVVGVLLIEGVRWTKARHVHAATKTETPPNSGTGSPPPAPPAGNNPVQPNPPSQGTPEGSKKRSKEGKRSRKAKPAVADWVAPSPCPTRFRPGVFTYGNITENGQTAYESDRPVSRITSANDTVRDGSAMFDVKQLGTGHFDNNTTVGNAEILKADKVEKLTATNSHAYANPGLRPATPPATSPSFNVGDWFEFMESYEEVTGDDARAGAKVEQLRERLGSEWRSLPKSQKTAYRKELDETLAAMKGHAFNVQYRDWPPTFVSRPCNP